MEFILQLLAQLFSAPVEDNKIVEKEEVKHVEMVSETEKIKAAEEQLEPNLFSVLDFH